MPAPVTTSSFDRFSIPDQGGHFGRYGGVFVPETLMTALQELGAAYEVARQDPVFQQELRHHLKEFAGRPTELYFAERADPALRRGENLSQARGSPAYGSAQNQQRARAGAIGAADEQKAHHRRNRRGSAWRGHRRRYAQNSVSNASFTWARSTWNARR